MAALAMSGAPPPLPSRSGRPEPPAVRTLPRRSSTSIDRLQPPQYPRNRRQSEGELPPPPPRNRHDPLPPVPPSIGSLPNPPANQQRQSSPYSSQTLPRNSRSDSSLQNQVAAPPVLPPRRGASLHGAHSPSTRPHLMNGSYPTPIQESDGMFVYLLFYVPSRMFTYIETLQAVGEVSQFRPTFVYMTLSSILQCGFYIVRHGAF